jgi:hypothetical protein
MRLKEMEKLTKKELRQRVDDAFEVAEHKGPGYLAEAQFYMRELEHRRDSWVSIRDLILEIFVIALIGWEIRMSYRAEQLQKDNFKDEKAVFESLQKSSGATADSLVAVKTSLEKQLALLYDVSVAVTFDHNLKRIVLVNNGRTNLYIWGDQLNRGKRVMEAKPKMITPGGSYYIIADSFYEELGGKLPKGSKDTIPFDVFIKNEVGDSFVIESQFFAVWYNDLLTIHTQTSSVRRVNW